MEYRAARWNKSYKLLSVFCFPTELKLSTRTIAAARMPSKRRECLCLAPSEVHSLYERAKHTFIDSSHLNNSTKHVSFYDMPIKQFTDLFLDKSCTLQT